MARRQTRARSHLHIVALAAFGLWSWSCTRSGFNGSGDALHLVDARRGDAVIDAPSDGAALPDRAPTVDGLDRGVAPDRRADLRRDGRPADRSIQKDKPVAREAPVTKDMSKDKAQPDKKKVDLPQQAKDAPGVKDKPPPSPDKKSSDGAMNPNGSYGLTPAITYTCAMGVVSFTINTMAFSDTGTKLTVIATPNGPGGGCNVLTGDTAYDGSFTATCTYPGACNEIYTLTATFAPGGNTWSGTFTATYVGSCINCTNQSWPVTGTRQ